MKRCSSGKIGFLTSGLAEDALVEARLRARGEGGPVTVYLCEDCNMYHLTSRGELHPRLKELVASGKLKLEVQSRDWIDKLKQKR